MSHHERNFCNPVCLDSLSDSDSMTSSIKCGNVILPQDINFTPYIRIPTCNEINLPQEIDLTGNFSEIFVANASFPEISWPPNE